MGHMNTLALTSLKVRVSMTPQEQRRSKLITKLEEQLALAEAEAAGRKHVVLKRAWTHDSDGNKVRVEREKRIKEWWWKDGDALTMVVRYGAKPVDLAKGGKKAITVPNIAAIPATIRTVIEAVNAGELDGAIETVLGATKPKLGKG